jgi:acyl-coenzyme A thioesterase PaaI-like protein
MAIFKIRLAGLTSLFDNALLFFFQGEKMTNRLSRYVAKINNAPQFMQSFLLTKLFCSQVKYAGTSNITLVKVTNTEVELVIKNKKAVQNHIGGVHAIAAALLAESATGIVFGINVPDSRLPLLKSMNISYQRRMQGDLKAHATLTTEQIQTIEQNEKGDMMVPVTITDESGEAPIECLMDWAWVSKKRK